MEPTGICIYSMFSLGWRKGGPQVITIGTPVSNNGRLKLPYYTILGAQLVPRSTYVVRRMFGINETMA